MRKICWLLLVGLAVMAVPSQAIFFGCDDICSCSLSCSHPCRLTPTSPLTNCGNAGQDCIQNCGLSADLTPAPACAPDGSEAPLFATPAPAETAEAAAQPAD